MKRLPSKETCNTVSRLWKSDQRGWSNMVLRVVDTMKQSSEILYPADSEALAAAAASHAAKTDKAETTLRKMEDLLLKALDAAPKVSVQKRIIAAMIAKGFTEKRKAELRTEKRLALAGPSEVKAYEDMKFSIEGYSFGENPLA